MDDLLVFTNEAHRSMQILMKTIGRYEKWLGQSIIKTKSTMIFSKQINPNHRRGLLGFTEGNLPFTYSGALMIQGRVIVRFFEPLIQKI